MSNKQSEAAVATTTTASDSKVSAVQSTSSESTVSVAVDSFAAKDNSTDASVPAVIDGAIVVESLQSAKPGEAEASIAVDGPIVSATPIRFSKEVRFVSCDKIIPNPKNKAIYGDESGDEEFTKDVEKNGIYQPLLVIQDKVETDKYLLLGGHRRLKAALQLDYTEVPVVIFDSTDELEQDEALVKSNRNRVKTTFQLAQEAKFLMDLETKRAALRMASKSATPSVKDGSHADKGKARDKVGKTIGVSGPTAEKMVEVAKAVESLEVEGKHDEAVELTKTLNKSVAGAHKAVKEKGLAKPKTTKAGVAKKGRPPKAKTFDGNDPQSDKALEALDKVVAFFRNRKAKSLTEARRRDWARALKPLLTWSAKLIS